MGCDADGNGRGTKSAKLHRMREQEIGIGAHRPTQRRASERSLAAVTVVSNQAHAATRPISAALLRMPRVVFFSFSVHFVLNHTKSNPFFIPPFLPPNSAIMRGTTVGRRTDGMTGRLFESGSRSALASLSCSAHSCAIRIYLKHSFSILSPRDTDERERTGTERGVWTTMTPPFHSAHPRTIFSRNLWM